VTADHASLAAFLLRAESDELRGRHFTVDADGPDVPPLYAHQADALDRLESRNASTILHLPTGAGKTRIATEFMARTLRRAPETHILWTSYPTTLIRQAMVRLAEYASKLPEGTRFAWLRSDARTRGRLDLFDDLQVSYALRGTLTSLMADIGDRPSKSPLRRLLLSGRPLLIIYDECHQLGARRLQRAWRLLAKKLPEITPPRVLGLSATPVPRHKRRRALLRHTIFPPKPGAVVDPRFQWGMDVGHRVHNRELEALGVLCPVNVWQQRSGFFDVPHDLLSGISRRRPMEEPPADQAGPDDLLRFSGQFNARVMSHPDVLRFLAGRLAARLPQLGKTLVFLPKIKTADALVELLEAHPATAGRVYLVHSRVGLDEEERAGPPREGVYEQLAAFTGRGDEPCIMVNVEMLTTGFDDPKIQTIVLGRLTYSMNLFWQMIGRGARGPRSRGTTSCNVIDPIRLTRLYPIADGYRPTLTRGNDHLIGGDEGGLGRMDPALSVLETPPAQVEPDIVDESWFDAVVLDEDELTALPSDAEPAAQASAEALAPDPEAGFGPPAALPATRAACATQRLRDLLAATSAHNLSRLCEALDLPAGDRDMTASALAAHASRGGRAGVGQLFDAMLGTEVRALMSTAGLATPTSKKAAWVVRLLHGYVLVDPDAGLRDLFAGHLTPAALRRLLTAGPRVYATLDARYDKRGLQVLLDRLGQPRSGKNKRVLLQRVFETFTADALAVESS
jgi:DNA repair protein RadD